MRRKVTIHFSKCKFPVALFTVTYIKEIEGRLKNIEVIQENGVLPRLETIESCYTSTYERYKNSTEDYEIIKQDISILKKVVTEHSEKLQRLA